MSIRQSPARTLDELQAQLREISERASALQARVDSNSILQRPRPESWSVAECIAHLDISNNAFFPIWDSELERAKGENLLAAAPYRLDFWGRILIWSMEPPPRFRVKAPQNIQPLNVGPTEQLFPGFLSRQRQIMNTVEKARGLAIDKIKIASPVDTRIRYSIWASFCLTATHERRHLLQAEQAVQAVSSH
jgi:hypothetical protein